MNLQEDFKNITNEKKEGIINELVNTNEYKETNSQILKMQQSLLNALPQEYKPLFYIYEEAVANLCHYQSEFYFKKGLEFNK